ncbi:MAG: peptidoglycan DD-metalloendopeptidase family protein [Gammaproteobacteria bacterium]
MSSRTIILSTCLFSLALAACGDRSIRAPVSSRGHDNQPQPSAAARTIPAKIVSRYQAGKDGIYVVQRDDTLSTIARRHGMGYKQLASINGIPSPYKIRVGQRLRLKPGPGAVVSAASVPTAGKARPAAATAKAPTKTVKQPLAAKASEVIEFDGKWQWPTRGRLLRGHKPNEPGKKGIYIGGHAGQPVKAAANGKVVYVGSGLVGYGRLIIIRHNENLLSTYGHNSELLVAEGEYVKAGQMIAKMGSSGTGRNDLYFEIRKDGKPVNPSAYLPKKN